MVRPAEFEEKDFEGPLYQQLLLGSPHFFTPGQVFEGHFGIDAALAAESIAFWSYFGRSCSIGGVVLNDFRWGFVWRRLGRRRTLPNFSVNALIQAKRPDVLMGRRSDFSARGISGPYWRFVVRQHQQQILERVSRILSNRALVVYAAPAFDTFEILYDLTESGRIVENSSFASISRLSGHNSWNYDRPGSIGIAASTPELVEEPSIADQVEEVLKSYDNESDANKGLAKLHSAVLEVCKESAAENGLAKFFLRKHESQVGRIQEAELKHKDEVTAFVGVVMFCDICDVMWCPLGQV